jgi:hypothetical protein
MNHPHYPLFSPQSLVGWVPKSSGMPPIADLRTQRSPALAGLNSEVPPKVSTASAVPVDSGRLAPALPPRCDGHHKNALFCRVLHSRGQAKINVLTRDRAQRRHLGASPHEAILQKRCSHLDEYLPVFDDCGISLDRNHARRPDNRSSLDIELPAVKVALDHVAFDEAFR